MADYELIPFYGVEPWQDNAGVGYPAAYGGGARLTGQNLVVTMWSLVADIPDKLLVPVAYTPDAVAFDATIPGFATKGGLNTFNSRTSARFSLVVETPLTWPVLAILNPPSDIKSQIQNAIKPNPNVPIFGFEVLKSLYATGFGFEFYCTATDSSLIDGASAFFGSPITPGLFATSGADGTPPVALPNLLAVGVPAAQNTLDAMNSGNFFIGALIQPGIETSGFFTINWPHTAARG
jgi:hypothetical protein